MQCYDCALRASELLASQIGKSERERERDPIEIFNELDQKRSQKDFCPELIDASEQHKQQQPPSPPPLPSEPEQPSTPQPCQSPVHAPQPSPQPPTRTTHRDTPNDARKRRLPKVTEKPLPVNKSRCLPHISGTERSPVGTKDRELPVTPHRPTVFYPHQQPKFAIPILRSHRIIPTSQTTNRRRKLPVLDSIIENPFCREASHSPPTVRTKKGVNPPMDESAYPCGNRIQCNGASRVGTGCLATPALRYPLVRTETETTYLTSSVGELHPNPASPPIQPQRK